MGHGQHTVYYQGSMNGRVISGRWEIPGNCEGRFQITCNRNCMGNTDRLLTGFQMGAGERLTSQNGEYFCVLQNDGNLCLYRAGMSEQVPQSLFQTCTNSNMNGPKSAWRLILQGDGHTCLYDGTNACKWASGLYGNRAKDHDKNQRLV